MARSPQHPAHYTLTNRFIQVDVDCVCIQSLEDHVCCALPPRPHVPSRMWVRRRRSMPPAPDAIGHAAHPDVAPTCRGPGRPRKHQAADAASSTPKRPRGRPKRIPAPTAELPPAPTVSNEPWKLRRKADLQQQAARAEPAPLPSPLPYRTRSEAGSPAEERRPFRNVEVRKLGPRRRHNGSQIASRTARNPHDRHLHADSHPDIDPGSAEMPKLQEFR